MFLETLTLIADLLIIFLLGSIFFKAKWMTFFKKYSLKFAFIVALTAMLGSLYYSEILHYTPCTLCWYQRILMYPLVLILGIALWKKDKSVSRYVLPMTIMGSIIAIWHYGTQRLSAPSLFCSTETSCNTVFSFAYGYITIPLMALSAFVLIFILMYNGKE